MAGMDYNKKVVSGGVAAPSLDLSINVNIEQYNKNSTSIDSSSLVKSDGTLDLNMFLEDLNVENYTTGAVEGSLGYDTAQKLDPPWYEELGRGLLSAGATVVNGAMGLLEGVAELGEGIIDAALIASAAISSGPLLIADALNFIGAKITGNEFTSLTQAFWTQGVMPTVGADLSGGLFDAIYSTEVMQAVDNAAIDSMKRGGAGYKVMKNVGYVTGTVAIGILTGGTSTIAVTASQASTIAAGMAKAGNVIESKYGDLSTGEKNNLGEISKVLLNGTLAGSLEAGMWFLTYGHGLDKVGAKLGITDWLGKKVFQLAGNNGFSKVLMKAFPNALKNSTLLKGGMQFLKPFITLGIDASTTGLDEKKTLMEYLESAFIDGLTNAAVTIGYDMSVIKTWVEVIDAKAASKIGGKADYAYKGNEIVSQSAESADDAMMDATKDIYKSLGEAIDKFRYSSDDSAAHVTRIAFEGFKKAGGNVVKKTIALPVKDFFKSVTQWATNGLAYIFGN